MIVACRMRVNARTGAWCGTGVPAGQDPGAPGESPSHSKVRPTVLEDLLADRLSPEGGDDESGDGDDDEPEAVMAPDV